MGGFLAMLKNDNLKFTQDKISNKEITFLLPELMEENNLRKKLASMECPSSDLNTLGGN